MQTFELAIDHADRPVSSLWAVPDSYRPGRDAALILAHGAGAGMRHRFMEDVSEALARGGLMNVRFNFPYTEAGRRAPDRPPVLKACWRAVASAVRTRAELAPGRLFLGGKSMGGRFASMLAADGEPCDGLVLLGYPLHPAGRSDKLRVAHLPAIAVPALFVQGTRDALCDLGLLREYLRPGFELHTIDGADHSFGVRKRDGRTDAEVMDEIVETTLKWISKAGTTAPSG